MAKKLYRCEYRVVYYSYVESEKAARAYARDAFNDTDPFNVEQAIEVMDADMMQNLDDGWDDQCLAYAKEEITLEEAFNTMKKNGANSGKN